MAQQLEETLSKLLVPDNNTIQAATQQLKELFKDPNIVPGLCQVLGSSQTPQVRQYAAVLLRRKIQKGRQWRAQPENVCQNIRENILQLLLEEPEKSVRNAIAQIAATVAKHDLPNNQWPQLFQFLTAYTKHENPAQREIGMFVLYTVSAAAAEQLKPHLVSLLQLLAEVVNDTQNRLVPYYAIRTMTELIFYIGDDEMKYIQGVIPRILQVVKELIAIDEDQACEILEVFDEMLECEVAILVPHIKPVVDFCLEIIPNKDLGDSVRVKAMSFISSLVKLKKKAFLKHKLVDPVLHIIFPVMCSADDDEEGEEDYEDEAESQTPSRVAPQVIDSMALHLPPDKIIPKLMTIVEHAIIDDKPSYRRASYMGLAMVAEGCADYITNKHLEVVLQCVVKGLNDPDHTVRNTALFALGQFSEHLQPDISKFASELLPLLFQYLGRATQEAEKNPKGLTKSYYALEMFCENLGKDILPYMPPLMEHLLTVLKTSTSNRMKELSISAIGAAANAAKEGMKPFFQEIIEQFKIYLTAGEDEELRKLQIQALDTLGVLARSIGEETFLPLAKECAQLGINLLQSVDDPDLRRCVYGLFAALSSLLKKDIGPYLEVLITHMMGSLKSTEGVKAHFKEEEEQVSMFNEEDFVDEEDLTGEEEDDEEDIKIEGISVENAFLDEKEDSCCALGEIAGNTGPVFFPYLEQSFQEVFDMIDYPADGIKKSAITAVGLMCVCVHKTNTESPTQDTQAALSKLISSVIPKLLDVIKEDKDRLVVMTAVDTISSMLEAIGTPVIQTQGYADAILTKMKEIFTHKLPCQDQDVEEDEEEQAEFDGMLIESAGDTLPKVAKLLGGDNFLPFFSSFLTDLLKRLKETSAVSERSFAVGTLAEIIEACGPSCALPFTQQLYPMFMKMTRDSDEEVRSNSIFALGVLLSNTQDKLYLQYPEVLKCLFEILNKESNPRVLDNICAATCRMIMSNKTGVPIEHIIPVIMQCLPLKEDFEENKTVFSCLIQLYGAGDSEVLKNTSKILATIANVLGTEQIKDDEQHILIEFVKDVNIKYPQDYQTVRSSLPPELGSKLDTCLTVTNGAA